MKKAEFIKIVSKIEDTFEDEFRAEFNSPELIWEALIKQLTIPVVGHPLFCETCKTNVSYWPDLDRHTCNCGRTIKAK